MSLDVAAVEAFTQGRLNRDDEETQRQLDAALAAARRYCGWHVTPALSAQTFTVDGPGTLLLALPTLALQEITAISEDGVDLDPEAVEWSQLGLLRKNNQLPWTDKFRGITVTVDHGYDAAPDFEAVVLTAIDRDAFASGSDTLARVIGPFQYDTTSSAAGSIFTDAERSVLDRYSLERMP